MGVMRWISMGLTLFSFGIAMYSLWLSGRQNRKLVLKNRELMVENAELRAQRDLYWEEIVELRERLYGGEEN